MGSLGGGLSQYGGGEQAGSEYLSDSPETEALQAPPGSGKKGGPSNWWALAAAPIIAALGSKMSGGQLNFNDALAHIGTGFAASKLTQMNQRRKSEFDEEEHTIELAHHAVDGLKKLSPEAMKKYPKLQELAQKYSDALADDGKISAKEASQIVVYHQMAQHDMQKAEQEQGQQEEHDTTLEKAQAGEEAQYNTRMSQIGRAMPPQGEMGPEPDDIRQHSQQQIYSQMYSPVDAGDGVLLPPEQALPYKRLQERQQRSKDALKIAQDRLKASQSSQGLSQNRLDYAKIRDQESQVVGLIRSMSQNDDYADMTPEQMAAQAIAWVQGVHDTIAPRPALGAGAPGASPVAGSPQSKFKITKQ